MKRLLAVLLVVGCLGAPALWGQAPASVVLGFQQDSAKLTVYITKTGEKYHREGCQYLRRSKIPVSLKDAVSRGFGPCSVCKPPTMARSS